MKLCCQWNFKSPVSLAVIVDSVSWSFQGVFTHSLLWILQKWIQLWFPMEIEIYLSNLTILNTVSLVKCLCFILAASGWWRLLCRRCWSANRNIQVFSGTTGCPGPLHCPVQSPKGLAAQQTSPGSFLCSQLPLESVSGQLTKYTGIIEQLKFACASFFKKSLYFQKHITFAKDFPGYLGTCPLKDIGRRQHCC